MEVVTTFKTAELILDRNKYLWPFEGNHKKSGLFKIPFMDQ